MHPLAIYALFTAASMAANRQAQHKVDKSTAAVMAEEQRLREASRKKSDASAMSTMDLFADSAGDEKRRAAELAAQYMQEAPPAAAPAPAPNMSDVVAPTRATSTVVDPGDYDSREQAFARGQLGSQAALDAYGDIMGSNQIAASRNASAIDRENSNMRNWTQWVLPGQLDSAKQAGNTWGTIADLIQVAGTIYGQNALAKPVEGGATAASKVGEAAASNAGGVVGNAGAAAQATKAAIPTATRAAASTTVPAGGFGKAMIGAGAGASGSAAIESAARLEALRKLQAGLRLTQQEKLLLGAKY